jgi:hypothetical protein
MIVSQLRSFVSTIAVGFSRPAVIECHLVHRSGCRGDQNRAPGAFVLVDGRRIVTPASDPLQDLAGECDLVGGFAAGLRIRCNLGRNVGAGRWPTCRRRQADGAVTLPVSIHSHACQPAPDARPVATCRAIVSSITSGARATVDGTAPPIRTPAVRELRPTARRICNGAGRTPINRTSAHDVLRQRGQLHRCQFYGGKTTRAASHMIEAAANCGGSVAEIDGSGARDPGSPPHRPASRLRRGHRPYPDRTARYMRGTSGSTSRRALAAPLGATARPGRIRRLSWPGCHRGRCRCAG